ncbi:restriction endonuclease [Pseudomonas edaphica]|uniref:Restriction endonuclease n=1 Tax=Pseudomonas edaphica TaxID=2006980 RepID=A0A7Y8FSR9_9PSED|nr:restriction endonuclease [Pseudomonas sp. IPO3747]NWE10421.1 restriction endonuclease [Pseudomonas edaphica]NWE84678.1 restriction endonuclease [Pseudomonas edaphica]
MTNKLFPIFELSPQDFEKLCLDVFTAEGGSYRLIHDDKNRWFDVFGEKPVASGICSTVAVEIKHRKAFHPEIVDFFVDSLSKSNLHFDEYVFVTSAPITAEQRRATHAGIISDSKFNIQLLGQQEVFQLLLKHPKIANRYFKSVSQKIFQRRVAVATSFAGILASVLSLLFTMIPLVEEKEKSSFESQIQSVETNLQGLKQMERNLDALKKELQATSDESAQIKRDYEAALKLKAITSEQLEQINKAVNSQTATDTALNYFFGFLFGVAGSILATVITDRWKARRELSSR